MGPHFESIGLNSLLSNGKNPAETLFPKLTKCTLQRYGPSGGIQNHDFLCVMTLNVVNEKIFAVLWFWYLLLLIVNGFNLAWRFVSYLTVVSCSGSASSMYFSLKKNLTNHSFSLDVSLHEIGSRKYT